MFRNTEDLTPFLEKENDVSDSVLDTLSIGTLKQVIIDHFLSVPPDNAYDSVWIHHIVDRLVEDGYDISGMNDYDRGVLYDVINDFLDRVTITIGFE